MSEMNDKLQGRTFPLTYGEVPWGILAKNGVDVDRIKNNPEILDQLLRGVETSKVPILMKEQYDLEDREEFKKQGRDVPALEDRPELYGTIRLFFDSKTGDVRAALTSERGFPDLKKPYMGHDFTEDEMFMLKSTNSIGYPIELTKKDGEKVEAFVGIHPITNAFRYVPVESAVARIMPEVAGHTLTADERALLERGDVIELKGLKSRSGDSFDAYYMISPHQRAPQLLYKSQVLRNQKNRGVVSSSAKEIRPIVGYLTRNDKGQSKGEQQEKQLGADKKKGTRKSVSM